MRFETYAVALEMLKEVREPLARIKTRNRDLADQIERAATSVLLNVAEGRRRTGRDRTQFFKIADGSNAEVRAAIDDASKALGYIGDVPALGALLDRCAAMLWRLSRG